MAPFPPTQRIKRRYILIKGSRESIEKAILDYIGILGWARAAPIFLPSGTMWICAVDRKELVHVRAALTLSPEKLEVIRVSGTLQGLRVLRKP